MRHVPYARQHIDEADIKSVVEVLASDFLTQGPAVERFEQAVASYCGVKYAVAVNSATSALHIACMAAELGEEEILWTSPNTFVASANCGLYCGAKVDFVDIDPTTYNMSVSALRTKLKEAKEKGALPKIVVPVHFSGQSCEMAEIASLAEQYGFTIIEDASHAIGGQYRQSKIGTCQYSDMTVLSFHPVKIITTAEGGMVLTNNKRLYDALLLYRSHGITRNPELMTEVSHGPWYYQQVDIGYNYRLTDLQAALGISQLQRIDEFVQRRHELADRYCHLLADLPLTLPYQHPDTYSAYHLYIVRLRLEKLTKNHRQIFEELRAAGIGVNLHYIPVHTQPYYKKMGFDWGQFPHAEEYYREAISLPMYFGLSDEEQNHVANILREILK